ncbi:MAG TPA: hypothetical protein VJS91_09215 [Nitrososphaeraceae archaeon]|nr:hypothetical protein [Nitrososphaeraceae archaeon]
MPNKGQKTITVSGETLKKLQKKYDLEKQKNPKISFASFISDSAIIELERRKILKEAQFISIVGFDDNVLTLKDYRKKERFVEIHLKNKQLWCNADRKYDCTHIGFALALPEVRSAINN